jgi:hypothetical protein
MQKQITRKKITMNSSEDTALVVSVHADTETRTLLSENIQERAVRINLKWTGEHDLADFNLERLGRLVDCEKETDHTGWALIEPRSNVNPGDTVPLR